MLGCGRPHADLQSPGSRICHPRLIAADLPISRDHVTDPFSATFTVMTAPPETPQNGTQHVPSSYVICTSPRSGSTLMCRMLAATGRLGVPDSYFHRPSLDAWANAFDIPKALPDHERVSRCFEAARIKGPGGADVFALRQQYPGLAFLCATLATHIPEADGDQDRLQRQFGPLRFIHLTRRDKLAQAVSLIRASQTGLWHRHADGTDLERNAPEGSEGYDATALTEQIAQFQSYDAGWQDWFTEQKITPLRVTYEKLATDPTAELRRVISWLGADPSLADGVDVPLQKLADATSAAWIARYQATS